MEVMLDKPRLRPADLVVFAGALSLFRAADMVREKPITAVLPSMNRQRPAIRTEDVDRAVRASQRAGPRAARWFGTLDTCLTRTMVAAILLGNRSQTRLAIGFRPSLKERTIDGHAWLAIGESSYQLTNPGDLDDRPYSCLAEIPIESRPDISAPRKNLPTKRLKDGTGITLDVEGESVIKTNATATVLLQAISRGVTGVAPLASVLTDQFDVDATTAERDVEAFLTELTGV